MLFIDNKYTKTYYRIIQRAKARPVPFGYTENHHIIPKCKPFCGPNTKENLVSLTFKEHWTCHHLLLKMVSGIGLSKMYFAFVRMGYNGNHTQRIINAKMFERIKNTNRILNCGKNSAFFGIKLGPRSEETKNKMSEVHKGKKHSDETKEQMQDQILQLKKTIRETFSKTDIPDISKVV